jgi:dTDP-4-amino-4,6-dideoxygalactose transaminase
MHPYHARHLFVVRLPIEQMRLSRNDALLALREQNVGAAIHYAPLHLMPLYCGRGTPASLPATEQVAPRIMTLPISAGMTVDDAHYVIVRLKAVMERERMP